eukprot:gene17161-22676_t
MAFSGYTSDYRSYGGTHDLDHPYHHESAMRMATDFSSENQLDTFRSRRQRILSRRGAFRWLPVYFSNDLVHGSWWFVLGSLLAMLIPAVPLLDLFYSFWYTEVTLPILQDAATFALLIVSGFFFTLGSLAFVRATEEPPLKPLFTWTHVGTDELLAAWLFLFASYMFVIACYPTNEPREQIVPYIASCCCSESSSLRYHFANDWLAGTWIFFIGTLLMSVGSFGMLGYSIKIGNNLEIFDWASSSIDSVIFLIGSAYFCAGSYSQEHYKKYESSNEKREHDPLLPGKATKYEFV